MELRVSLSSVFLQGGIKQSDLGLPHQTSHQRKSCPLLHSSESRPGVLFQPVLLVLFLMLGQPHYALVLPNYKIER